MVFGGGNHYSGEYIDQIKQQSTRSSRQVSNSVGLSQKYSEPESYQLTASNLRSLGKNIVSGQKHQPQYDNMMTPDILRRKIELNSAFDDPYNSVQKKKTKPYLKDLKLEKKQNCLRTGSISAQSQHKVIFPMQFQEKRGLDVSDIIGDKQKLYRQRLPKTDSLKFAGVKRDSVGNTLSRNHDFIYPRKNNSVAFDHLDTTQKAYNDYLSTTTQKNHTLMVLPPATATSHGQARVAGIAIQQDVSKMDRLLNHNVRYVDDKRTQKKEQDLPVNPTRYVVNRADRAKSQLFMDRRARPKHKKIVNLWDGYVRLFCAETSSLERSMPDYQMHVHNGKKVCQEENEY